MFDAIPHRYALLNKILTFGRDEAWRRKACSFISPDDGGRILDICTGTGDLALKIAERFPQHTIYALDFSPRMLDFARETAKARRIENIIFREGDVGDMGFEDGYFDYVTISFGFRNLSHSKENLLKSLKEVYRVLKPGGRFVILETSQPRNTLVRRIFHLYAKLVVPLVGKAISGEKAPYAYLGSSISRFLSYDKLTEVLTSAGFELERTVAFMLGMVRLSRVLKKVNFPLDKM